jgi:PAT family beta-lactamase induction signal transducer AmpG
MPSLPALAEHRRARLGALAALYFCQGLPDGLLFVAVPAWLAERGVPATAIGEYIALILLPWSFKLVNGPIMDRWSFLAMGRRRPWVLLSQFAILGTLLSMLALPDPVAALGVLTAAAFAVNFSASFQDVAIDGMAIDILPEEEQARANGIMWGSKTIGISAGAGLNGLLIARWGFDAAIIGTAALVGLIMIAPLLLRERPGERLLPWTAGQASATARRLQEHDWRRLALDLWKALRRAASLIFILMTFLALMVYGLDTAALPVMTVQELGWAQEDYTGFNTLAGVIAGLVGMTLGGPLIDRFGTLRSLATALLLTAGVHAAMAWLAPLWPDRTVIHGYMVTYGILYVLMSVALYATAMRLCEKHVSATQFAIYMSFVNLGTSAGAGILGRLRGVDGYPFIFFVMAAGSVAAMLLALAVARFETRPPSE